MGAVVSARADSAAKPGSAVSESRPVREGTGAVQTGLEAELFYKANPFIALRRNHRAVKGKIYNSSSSKILFEIDGHWDR